MPKRINLKESKDFYYAYKIGKTNNIVEYSDIIKAQGQFVSYTGNKIANYYGEQFDYNATLIVEDSIKYIDEFTKIWYGSIPFSNLDEPTHNVVRKGLPQNGLRTIYLKSTVSNENSLWVEYNDKILEVTLFFDYENLVGKVLKDTFCPIDYLVNVWTSKPINNSILTNKIELTYKKEESDCILFYFKKVE